MTEIKIIVNAASATASDAVVVDTGMAMRLSGYIQSALEYIQKLEDASILQPHETIKSSADLSMLQLNTLRQLLTGSGGCEQQCCKQLP
ncbi:hypothetical protein [Yokenella regensburgei]|uniref:hypothetical protein n=1 Tax=Yokenella regensburgei TaxID=158877 RepID=UPI0031E121D9